MEWEICEQSGYQRLDINNDTYWLTNDRVDVWEVTKAAVDYAGPNFVKVGDFDSEQLAKEFVAQRRKR